MPLTKNKESELFDWLLVNPDAKIEDAAIFLRSLQDVPLNLATKSNFDYHKAPSHSNKTVIDNSPDKRPVILTFEGKETIYESILEASFFLGKAPTSVMVAAQNFFKNPKNGKIKKRGQKGWYQVRYYDLPINIKE